MFLSNLSYIQDDEKPYTIGKRKMTENLKGGSYVELNVVKKVAQRDKKNVADHPGIWSRVSRPSSRSKENDSI